MKILLCSLLFQLALTREPSSDHVGGNAARNIRRAKGISSEVGSLAELVASRKGKGVHYRQNQRNN